MRFASKRVEKKPATRGGLPVQAAPAGLRLCRGPPVVARAQPSRDSKRLQQKVFIEIFARGNIKGNSSAAHRAGRICPKIRRRSCRIAPGRDAEPGADI